MWGTKSENISSIVFDDEFEENKECCCAGDVIDSHRYEESHSRSVMIGSVITLMAIGVALTIAYFVIERK